MMETNQQVSHEIEGKLQCFHHRVKPNWRGNIGRIPHQITKPYFKQDAASATVIHLKQKVSDTAYKPSIK